MTDMQLHLQAQPLIAHIVELRRRLLICALVFCAAVGLCYTFADQIYGFLLEPLQHVSHDRQRRLIYTGLSEAFTTYLKVALFTGSLLTMPVILLQVWRFIAPGLFQHEQRMMLPFVIATPLLFLLGLAMAFYVVIPLAWSFFLGFEQLMTPGSNLPIVMEPRVSEYLSLTMSLLITFGMAFELPVLMGLLAKTGLIKAAQLTRTRRYAIIVILIIAAIFSPPDVISQTSLAIPLYGLYEISILIVRWMEKQKAMMTKPDEETQHA
jgi:sec-independent protein translocase protein TatC